MLSVSSVVTLLCSACRHCFRCSEKRGLSARRTKRAERKADDLPAFPAEHSGRGEIHLADHATRIDGHVADRCEVVQIDVAVARLLERTLRLDELMVLGAELFLVDFELVNELGEGLLVNALQLQIPKSLGPGRRRGSSLEHP